MHRIDTTKSTLDTTYTCTADAAIAGEGTGINQLGSGRLLLNQFNTCTSRLTIISNN